MLLRSLRLCEARNSPPFYESVGETFDVDPFAEGQLVNAIARRFSVSKLKTENFNRLYVVFDPAVPTKEVVVEDGVTPKSLAARYGMPPGEFNQMPSIEKAKMIGRAIFQSLKTACADTRNSVKEISHVEAEFENNYESQRIEIECKSKHTKSYSVSVCLSLTWDGTRELFCVVRYQSNSVQVRPRVSRFRVETDDEAYALVGSISVKREGIIIAPRSSAIATIFTNRHETPLKIPIEEMEEE